MATVYFLGAGATKAFRPNAPLNDDLLDLIYNQNYSNTNNEIDKSVTNVRKFIENIFYKIENHIEKKPYVGDILSFVDYLLKEKTFSLKNYSYQDIELIRNDLVYIIAHYFKKSLDENIKNDATNENDKMIAYFINDILKSNDTIISTNYDLVIDNALAKITNINYGVTTRRAINIINNSINQSYYDTDMTHIMNQSPKELLKINGSLNWLYCPRCDELDITANHKGVIYIDPQNKLKCDHSYCTANYEPLLVTPTNFKIYKNRILKEIWDKAKKKISEADEIIFVGYSLPKEDFEIKCMLLEAINKANAKKKIKVIDIKKRKDAVKNYEELFGKVVYHSKGFKNYIEKIKIKKINNTH